MKKAIILGFLLFPILICSGCSVVDTADKIKVELLSQEDIYGETGANSTGLSEEDTLKLSEKLEQFCTDNLEGTENLKMIYNTPDKDMVLYAYTEPESTEVYSGYGVIWLNNKFETISIFPEVSYGKAQNIYYDELNNRIFFTSMIGGTGVSMDELYVFNSSDNGTIELLFSILPDSIINDINNCMDIKFDTVKGEVIYYYNETEVGVSKLPDFIPQEDFEGVYIGDQLHYELRDGKVIIELMPGYKYASRSDLVYENAPILQGEIAFLNVINDLNSYQINEINLK